jgi:hypothetical protein
MGFLGVTFSATIAGSTNSQKKHLLIISVPVIMLVVSSVAGSLLAEAFDTIPSVKLGLISFCVVALLFLVTQELLTEAREATEGLGGLKSMAIDSVFFFGVFVTLVMDKALAQ